jgi:inhibitor of KinA sporulation pathway (predicted exonuclease)
MMVLMDKKYLMVIDLEATCFERGSEPEGWFQEIIEVGLVLLASQTLEIVETHQQFVKPVLFPELSPFCKGLTTISQSQADGGISFRSEMSYLSELYADYNRPMFFSFGKYDYNQILRQCNRFKVDFPFRLEQHVNIKQAFNKLYNKNFFRGVPHKYALKFFNVSIEGTHHRALDDALTISKFLVKMVKDGLKY